MNNKYNYRWHVPARPFLNKLKFRIVILTIALTLGGLYLLRSNILSMLGNFLVVNTSRTMSVADYGIVLSGEYPERAIEAATLYREGVVQRLIVSQNAALRGVAVLKQWNIAANDETTNNLQLLLRLGVPRERIMVSPLPATSTSDEARLMASWLKVESGKPRARLLIITSASHSRRALYIFQAIAGDAVELAVKPSRYDSFDAKNWWQDRYQLKFVVNEYLKLATRALFR